MTTIDGGQTTVTRSRRRPTKTATNARTSRAIFGDDAVKKIVIPQFIDIYNHFIGGVDQADQLRSYNHILRISVKNSQELEAAIAFSVEYLNCERLKDQPLYTSTAIR